MNTKILAVAVVAILIVAGVGIYVAVTNSDKNSNGIDIDVNLEVFGNADKNDSVDSDDADLINEYLEAIESGDDDAIDAVKNKMSMDFADANQDGVIDSKDVDQINGLTDNTAKYIWILDGVQDVRKIDRNITRIGAEYFANTELCLILGLADKVAAVDYAPYMYKDFYFTESQQRTLGELGAMNAPNYDELNELDLDILLTFYTSVYEAKQDKIIDCDVVYLGLYNPDLTNTDKSAFVQGVLKAGYIFGTVDRAEGYVNWLLNYRDTLMDLSKSIPESDKKTVLMHTYGQKYLANGTDMTLTVYKPADPLGQAAILGGTHNVYDDIAGDDITSSSLYGATVSVDVILGDKTTVDYIFLHMVRYTYAGTEMKAQPQHGYLYNGTSEAEAGYKAVNDLEYVEDDMSVYLVAGEFRNGCTGGVLLGAFIGSIVNPDVYKDVDPYKMMNEYINDWMGIKDYDAKTDGLFIYPSA